MPSSETSTPTVASTRDSDGTVVTYEWRPAGQPSTGIVQAVAAETDSDPLEIAPLYDHVDADALDTLVSAEASSDSVHVSFRYCGFLVLVDNHGRLELQAVATGCK